MEKQLPILSCGDNRDITSCVVAVTVIQWESRSIVLKKYWRARFYNRWTSVYCALGLILPNCLSRATRGHILNSDRFASFLVVSILSFILGCGGTPKDPLKRQPVSGNVTLDGKPMDQGSISFQPLTEAGATASGATIAAGHYKIPAESGLAPGEYRVVILSPEPEAPRSADEMMNNPSTEPRKERVAPKFNTATELKVSIKEGAPNTADFAVTGP